MKHKLTMAAASAMLLAGCATHRTGSPHRAVDPGSIASPLSTDVADNTIGAQTVSGELDGKAVIWTSFRDFTFALDDDRLQDSDSVTSANIAYYMRSNPSLQLGLHGSMDSRASGDGRQALSDRRIEAVRASLIKAGVPPEKIHVGMFGSTLARHDNRIEVLFATFK